MTTNTPAPFPTHGLLPKDETKASNLLLKHPTYDGRNTVIAILDTGVDPSAHGLQVTSFNNQPKLIDIVDCTGSGDILMTKEFFKPVTNENTLVGLTGRTLTLNPDWVNPKNQYRLGMISAFQIYGPVQPRIAESRKRQFMLKHQKLHTHVQSLISTSTAENKDRLESQLQALQMLMDQYEDAGPIYDVLVYHDGDHFRVVVDTNESGDLSIQPTLASYRFFRQFHKFGSLDNMCFSVNVYDAGKLVSLVTMAGSHGTHVASICAKYDPDDQAQNGIAPGAQLVSIKIGDSRLGSMETGAALSRAVLCMVQNKVDLANMSYGEAVGCVNTGRFVELLRDVCVFQYQICFVSSAGNAGPALSTVGAPGGTTEGVISVGAHVSRAQVLAEYALVNDSQVLDQMYTWSSRGPTYDGDYGVDIVAPGSAITSVPSYTLLCAQLMNGTSMSSPNACGNIALLISAWKAAGNPDHKINSFRILRALQHTGKPVDSDPFHRPFIQVDKALEYLMEHKADFKQDIHFRIAIGAQNQRGLYLRNTYESQNPFAGTVNVKPVFHTPVSCAADILNKAYMSDMETEQVLNLPPVPDSELDSINTLKLKLDLRLVLVPSHPWIRVPQFVQMTSDGRNIPIEVDAHLLPVGLHVGKVEAFDTADMQHPLFTIPVTVTKPINVDKNSAVACKNVHMSGGTIERRFIAVPVGATHVELRVRSQPSQGSLPTSNNTPAGLLVRTVQLVPQLPYSQFDFTHRFQLRPDSSETYTARQVPVVSGITMELVLAQWWSGVGDYEVDVDAQFHGLVVTGSTGEGLALVQGHIINQLNVVSTLGRLDQINLSISIDQFRKFYRPERCLVKPMSGLRDILPNTTQVYELVQTYTVKSFESQTILPKYVGFETHLYDSPYDAFLILIHDAAGRLLATHDIFANKPFKVVQGAEYLVSTQIRHHQISVLEKLKDLPLAVDFSAPKSQVSADLYLSYKNAVTRENAIGTSKFQVLQSKPKALFAVMPSNVKDTCPGDVLVAKMQLTNPPGMPELNGGLTKVLIPITNGKPLSSNGSPKLDKLEPKDGEKPEPVTLETKIRDLKVDHLKSMKRESDAQTAQIESLIMDLDASCGKHLPYMHVKLEQLPIESTGDIIALATEIINDIDPKQLLTDLARLVNEPNGTANKTVLEQKKKVLETRKQMLVLALQKRASALLTSYGGLDKRVVEAIEELKQWVLPETTMCPMKFDALEVLVKYKCETGDLGAAVKDVLQYIQNMPMVKDNVADLKRAYALKLRVLTQLEWGIYVLNEEQWQRVRFPHGVVPF